MHTYRNAPVKQLTDFQPHHLLNQKKNSKILHKQSLTYQRQITVLTYVWLLNLHVTPVKLLYSWMENTVIQHTFPKFDHNKKYRSSIKTLDKTETNPDLVKKNSSGNTCAEKVSWKGHYERVFTGVGDESTESCCPPSPHSIGNPPSASHAFCCCCQTNWWFVVRRVQMVSRFEATCICTRWAGERSVEQMSRLRGGERWVEQLTGIHGGVNEADVSTAAPDRCAVLCGWMDQG